MQYVFKEYIQSSLSSLILMCDDLQAYNLIIKGRSYSIDEAFIKAKRQGENMMKMILNVQKQFNNVESVHIAKWMDIASENKYLALLKSIKKLLRLDKGLRDFVDEFVTLHVQKFRWKVDKEALEWEERYLLQEITMSIYVTEILEYSRELWETPPNPNFPDPIGYLYESRPELVQMLVGNKTLKRKLEILAIPKTNS